MFFFHFSASLFSFFLISVPFRIFLSAISFRIFFPVRDFISHFPVRDFISHFFLIPDTGDRPSSRGEVSAGSRRWVCWGGSGSAGIPVGGVRESRDAREFTRGRRAVESEPKAMRRGVGAGESAAREGGCDARDGRGACPVVVWR